MAVDREEFERLDRALRTNVRLAIGRIAEACEGLDGLPPDELEAALMEVMAPIVVEHGDVAATIALEWYERQREAAGAEGEFTPTLAEPVPRSYVAADVREAVEPQRRGSSDFTGLVANLQGRTTRLVMRPADETFRINVEADPAHPRWAFVPHVGACGFCVMLGSNGWMYSSRQAVLRSRHTNCTCTPVADFDTENPHLDGYDPEWMRQAYSKCHDTVIDEVNRKWAEMTPEERARYKRGKTDFERDMVVAEMNRRDREWLRSGTVPKPRYQSPRAEHELNSTERATRDVLSANGFTQFILERSNVPGQKTADLILGEASMRADYKTPRGIGLNCIDRLLRDAGKKSELAIIHLQAGESKMEIGDAINYCRQCGRRRHVYEVLLVDYDGSTIRIWN